MAARLAMSQGAGGQLIELSGLNSLLSLATIHIAAQTDPDDFDGPRVMGPFYPPQRGWKTKGRPIAFSFGGAIGQEGRPGHNDFLRSIKADWLLQEPRVASDPTGLATTGIGPLAEECRPLYEKAFEELDDDTLVAAIRRFGGVAAPYHFYDDLAEHPQLAALGTIVSSPDRSAKATAFPAHFGRALTKIRWSERDEAGERPAAAASAEPAQAGAITRAQHCGETK